jgi:hypothetical protein
MPLNNFSSITGEALGVGDGAARREAAKAKTTTAKQSRSSFGERNLGGIIRLRCKAWDSIQLDFSRTKPTMSINDECQNDGARRIGETTNNEIYTADLFRILIFGIISSFVLRAWSFPYAFIAAIPGA